MTYLAQPGISLGCLLLVQAAAAYPVDFSSTGTGGLTSLSETWNPLLSAGVLLVVLVFVIAGCLCCHPRSKGFHVSLESVEKIISMRNNFYVAPKPTDEKPAQEFRNSNGSLALPVTEFVNPLPTCSELTLFPPTGAVAPPPPTNSNTLRPAAFAAPEHPFSSHDWFGDGCANLPRNQLQFLEEYGRGWFGRVVIAEAHYLSPDQPRTKVIVKMLHEDATATDQMFFLHEVKPHRDLKHPNILPLLARCLDQQPYLLVFEACPNGDVKSFLLQNAASAHALCEGGVPFRMARDITLALEFMHSHRFVHTDLAARNALVARDLTVKLGDYGNSIELHPGDYYIAGNVALPLRWCAPETLKCTDHTIETREVTPAANLWSLAVTIWEIVELGRLPYGEISDDQVIARVLSSSTPLPLVLPKPTRLSKHVDELYNLMRLCWQAALQRPTATQVRVILDNLLSSDASSQMDFDERWRTCKPNHIAVTDNADIADGRRGSKVADSSASIPRAFQQKLGKEMPESPRVRLTRSPREEPSQGELDSWLAGVPADTEEEQKLVKDVSDAIRELDAALELEKTSSSEEGSPEKDATGSAVEFRLGSFAVGQNTTLKSFYHNTDEPASLLFESVSNSLPSMIGQWDAAEDAVWAARIERGEFTQKVKEKSRSIADLMVLTWDVASDESDSDKDGSRRTNRGSDTDIRNAVLEEGFHESLKRLSTEHKETGHFDSLNMFFNKTPSGHFLCRTASESPSQPQCQSAATAAAADEQVTKEMDSGVASCDDAPDVSAASLQLSSSTLFGVNVLPADTQQIQNESNVSLGPFEEHTLRYFQAVSTSDTQQTANFGDDWLETGRTPDDERSSDSGFRDKGSLSESVEDQDDALHTKYNLEDIEAELQDAYVNGAFDSQENQRVAEDEDDDDGWCVGSPSEPWPKLPDDPFLAALRTQLANTLPVPCRSFEQRQNDDDEEEEETSSHKNCVINIDYSSASSSALTPILEDCVDSEETVSPGRGRVTRSRKQPPSSPLLESVRNMDTESFAQYLDYLVENEGKEEHESMNLQHSDQQSDENFLLDVREALQDQPDSVLVLEDLEDSAKAEPTPQHIVDSCEQNVRVTDAFESADGSLSGDNDAWAEMSSLSDVSALTPDRTPFESPRNVARSTPILPLLPNNEAQEICDSLWQTANTDEHEGRTEFRYSPDPDWDSNSGGSECSSSGFVWQVMEEAAAAAGPDDVDDDDSDSNSIMDFVPSAWDCTAIPSKPALKLSNKVEGVGGGEERRVSFKKEKYHCVYEYPREPNDVDDATTTTAAALSRFTDWQQHSDDNLLFYDDDDEEEDFCSSDGNFMGGSQFWAAARQPDVIDEAKTDTKTLSEEIGRHNVVTAPLETSTTEPQPCL